MISKLLLAQWEYFHHEEYVDSYRSVSFGLFILQEYSVFRYVRKINEQLFVAIKVMVRYSIRNYWFSTFTMLFEKQTSHNPWYPSAISSKNVAYILNKWSLSLKQNFSTLGMFFATFDLLAVFYILRKTYLYMCL